MKRPSVLVALGVMCLLSGLALAYEFPPPKHTVNIWVDHEYEQPLAPGGGTVSFDIVITELERLNVVILYGGIQKYNQVADLWEPTTDLNLVSMEVHPDLLASFPLDNVEPPGHDWPTLDDWVHGERWNYEQGMYTVQFYAGSTTRPAEIPYENTPDNPSYAGTVATYTYEYTAEAVGLYDFNLESRWIDIDTAGEEQSTMTSLGYGLEMEWDPGEQRWKFGDEFSLVPVGHRKWVDFMELWQLKEELIFAEPITGSTTTGQFQVIPEPTTMVLLGAGLMSLVAIRRRK